MNQIAILLDSTCDMTINLLHEYDIDYVPMGFSIGDKEYSALLSWDNISPKEFYETMKKTRVYTNQVKDVYFEKKFNELLDQKKDILYLGCSSGLSKSVSRGEVIAREIMAKRPGAQIRVVDSLISGMGQGLLGIYASSLRKEGKTLDEIVSLLKENRLKYNQWGTVDDLNYLKRAGRVKASAAFFGNIFGVKPIIISDICGNNFAYKKVKGRKASLEEIANSVASNIVDPENHYVAISHADSEKDALELKSLIESKIKVKGFYLTPLGPILGASCGPNTIIAFHYGKEVTLKGE